VGATTTGGPGESARANRVGALVSTKSARTQEDDANRHKTGSQLLVHRCTPGMMIQPVKQTTYSSGPRAMNPTPDVVGVYVCGIACVVAKCTCGWVGKHRHFKAAAKNDALIHAAQVGCHPASPLAL
jgi:hypothetical protein